MSASRRSATRRCTVLSRLLLAALPVACAAPPPPDYPAYEVELPDPAEVNEVLFLVGDAGNAMPGQSPLLAELSDRVERWSDAVARDSAVTVIFLGDNVYPVGVRDGDHPAFPTDSARLRAQIGLLAGNAARRRGSLGLFLAGNHDWGNMTGERGIARLRNQQEQIERARELGLRVRMVPEAGSPGPEVIDLRHNTRVIAIDTHWFLQQRSQRERDLFLERVLTAADEADDRHIVVVAHHPWSSAGEHGVLTPAGEALGLAWVLKKSGTLVQDLNSPIYRELRARLRTAFTAAERQPLVYAAGHDHSLQVVQGSVEFEPLYQLVSGAGSKSTEIQSLDALTWGAPHLGYMILMLLEDESVRLYIVSSDTDRLACTDPDTLAACMEEETARFALRYSEELAPPRSLPAADPEPDSGELDVPHP